MKTRPGDSRLTGSGGFTLVEMIVALAVFSTVMTVVFITLAVQQRSFAVQNDRTEIQKSLRHAINILEKELKNAGSGFPFPPRLILPAGWGGGIRAHLGSGVEVTVDESGGPESLAIVNVLSHPVRLTRGMATASSSLPVDGEIPWSPGMLGMISDGTDAEIFRVTGIDGKSILQHKSGGIFQEELSKPYARGASVARILLAGYAVSVPNDQGLTALVRREIDGDGNLRDRTIVEAVSDLRVRWVTADGSEKEIERQGSDTVSDYPAVSLKIRSVSRGRLDGESRPWEMDAIVGLRNRRRGL